jgi:predicted transcriptional regulator
MDSDCPVRFTNGAVNEIIADSGGYPYFVQFLCKEAYDSYLQQISIGITSPVVTIKEVMRKLDSDFFAGRWNRVTDRQRDLLAVIAKLPNAEEEFTVQEIAERSKTMEMRNFSPSQINQMLNKLAESGLIYKNRHGKYSFAVPMLSQFINRLPIG